VLQNLKTKDHLLILGFVFFMIIGLSVNLFTMYDLFQQSFSSFFSGKIMMVFAFCGIIIIALLIMVFLFKLCVWILSKSIHS